MATIITTAVEVNYIIFRYLEESGFTHTAFNFCYEAGVNKSTVDGNMVPRAALVKIILKGLKYIEMEANVSNVIAIDYQANNDEKGEYFFLETMDLITREIYELQEIVGAKKKNQQLGGATKLVEEKEGAPSCVKRKDQETQDMDRTGTTIFEWGSKGQRHSRRRR